MTEKRQRVFLTLCLAATLLGCGDGDPAPAGAPPAAATPTATPIPSLHQQFVTDAQGRALILHGLNVSGSAKDDPLRQPWITRTDAERVQRDWGFNLVRYLIFWDAVEPQPGQYDDAYLDRVAERIDWFASVGVYVILDMHQDVYGKFDTQGKVLGFDGAPSWAGVTDGLPHRILDPWGLTYTQPGVRRAFDNFWNSDGAHGDLQEHYAAMWAHVAARFKGHPWVLGYNLMNEPFAGNAAGGDFAGIPFGDEALSRKFQGTLFRDFHDRVIARIRTVDPDGWIFYEPLAFPVNNGGPSDLPKLTDPRAGENRLAYFPHLYAVSPEIQSHYDPTDAPELDSWIAERRRDLPALGVPMMIGEFGLPWSAGGEPLGYLGKIMTAADELTSGWAYWTYDIDGWGPVASPDLHENPNVDVLVRAYPQRVAGRPIVYHYDAATRIFDLTFEDAPGVSGATEIYIPARRFYPAGWELTVDDPPGTWSTTWDASREVVALQTTQPGVHSVSVRPLQPR